MTVVNVFVATVMNHVMAMNVQARPNVQLILSSQEQASLATGNSKKKLIHDELGFQNYFFFLKDPFADKKRKQVSVLNCQGSRIQPLPYALMNAIQTRIVLEIKNVASMVAADLVCLLFWIQA